MVTETYPASFSVRTWAVRFPSVMLSAPRISVKESWGEAASNDMMAAGARLAAKGAGKKDGDIKIIGTDGLPGPSGGIRAVAQGEWSATFTYPTGAQQAIDMAKAILVDCAEKVDPVVTVATMAITPDNAKQLMGK